LIEPSATIREAFAGKVRASFASWIDSTQPHFESQLAHALSRFDDGVALYDYCELPDQSLPAEVRDVLDLGSGNGGVALAFANSMLTLPGSPHLSSRKVARSAT
jgi:hypothetical protein